MHFSIVCHFPPKYLAHFCRFIPTHKLFFDVILNGLFKIVFCLLLQDRNTIDFFLLNETIYLKPRKRKTTHLLFFGYITALVKFCKFDWERGMQTST